MALYSLRYGFTQRFRVPARKAFDWCIDYDQNDHALMGEEGRRKVARLSENLVMLEDSALSKSRKRKLVNIYPEKLFWSSVHIAGPAKYSQFLYQIIEDGRKSSRLDFIGFQVMYADSFPSRAEISRLAKKLEREDSAAWKNLAKAMEKDLM